MLHPKKDLAGHTTVHDACSSASSGAPSAITAGGGLDNLEVTGQAINRLQGGAMAQSAVISTAFLAALGASETLSLGHKIQESSDGSSWDTAEVLQAATIVGTGAGNLRGAHSPTALQLNLAGRKQYFRINVTPDLSRANTDTATFHTQAVLGGYDVLPQ